MSLIDLRSDTVTRPTPGMRAAMYQMYASHNSRTAASMPGSRRCSSARHCSADIAPVPESVSRSMVTSSERRPNRFQPARSSACWRCSLVRNGSGSIDLIGVDFDDYAFERREEPGADEHGGTSAR